MNPQLNQIEANILRLLRDTDIDTRLGYGRYGLVEAIYAKSRGQQPTNEQIMQAVWALVGRGTAYIDFSQPDVGNWRLVLSDSGRGEAPIGAATPDNPELFLDWLSQEVPLASPVVFHYASESLVSYNARCFLASSVMLGLAIEMAFLEAARAFGNALPDGRRQIFLQSVENPRTKSTVKMKEFRKRAETYYSAMPHDLVDGLGSTLDSVAGLMSVYRTEHGHPALLTVSRDDAFINLQLFARHLKRLYYLKQFFDEHRLHNEETRTA